jgi:type IV secretion system protein VirB10
VSEPGHALGAPARPPKEDPETLVLRGRPRPVVRFRRGLVVGLAGTVAAALVAVAWVALEPPSLRLAGSEDGEGEPLQGGVPQALSDAPGSYGEVPELGPPLPGDLGRPILAHQRELDEAPAEPAGLSEADRARAAAEAERQRRVAERQAARSSGVIVQRSGQGSADAPGGAEPVATAPASRPPAPAGADAPTRINPAPSPWTLAAGTVIPASLITGLNSDHPGTVVAQVTENVRDSATGRTVLIPQGARLIGRYESAVAYGQRRALLVWQRIVFPDASSLPLDDVPATDRAGHAGVEDGVDFHTEQLLRGIGLATLLGVGTEIGLGDDEGDLVRALREASQDNAARTGERIVARNLDIEPTLTVRPGWPVRAIVTKDLVLTPWGARSR